MRNAGKPARIIPSRRYNHAMASSDLTFVLGGARSGKSVHAEQLAASSGRKVTYIATARIADREFAARVAHHRERRPGTWKLVEAPVDLAAALAAADAPDGCVLIDCLTLWLANLLCPPDGDYDDEPTPDHHTAFGAFEAALAGARGQVIVVSNEIGLGVVPLGAETRHYVDELGRLNQRVAALCANVTMMVAGLPLVLKSSAASANTSADNRADT